MKAAAVVGAVLVCLGLISSILGTAVVLATQLLILGIAVFVVVAIWKWIVPRTRV